MSFRIRPFHPNDLEAVLRIYQVAFSDEFQAQGLTPETAAQRIRQVARGRMIPFRVLTRLLGSVWGAFVAETEGRVVGLGIYFGDRHSVGLGPLMVLPEYRRRGIGQALLQTRLESIAQQGGKIVIVSVLRHNQASLGNLRKQGFEIYDRLTEFDIPLPLAGPPPSDIVVRSAAQVERARLEALEREVVGATRLEIEGSVLDRFYPSVIRRLYTRLLSNAGVQRWVVERAGQPAGLLTVAVDDTASKGSVPVLMAADHDPELEQAMLTTAAVWLTERGKTAMRVVLPDDDLLLSRYALDPSTTWHWLTLVKRLP